MPTPIPPTLTQLLLKWNNVERVRKFPAWAYRKWKEIPSFLTYGNEHYFHIPERSGDAWFVFRKDGDDTEYTFCRTDINRIWMEMLEEIDCDRRILHARHSGYECSTKGDIRFSAFEARLENGRTIEVEYQTTCKGYPGDDWRLGKSRPPANGKSRDELWEDYYRLWKSWADKHQPWMFELHYLAAQNDYTLADKFSGGVVNQARALAEYFTDHSWDGHSNLLCESSLCRPKLCFCVPSSSVLSVASSTTSPSTTAS